MPKGSLREFLTWTAVGTSRPATLVAAIDEEDNLLIIARDPDTDEAFQCWKVLPDGVE